MKKCRQLFTFAFMGFALLTISPSAHALGKSAGTAIPYNILVQAFQEDLPWWNMWWFRILEILAVIGLTILFFNLRIRSMRAANLELEKRVAERTRELQEAEERLKSAEAELQAKLNVIAQLEQKAREQAIRDPLTELYNRRYLSEVLGNELSRAARYKHAVALVLINVDHFKNINDTFGQEAGDTALKIAAQVVLTSIRRSDTACRYGDAEFLVVLPNISKEDAFKRAEQIRADVEEMNILHEGKTLRITVSIGIAMYPLHGDHSDQMLIQVDQALYKAKEAGRNRVVAL